jgi:hypothetical protein
VVNVTDPYGRILGFLDHSGSPRKIDTHYKTDLQTYLMPATLTEVFVAV